MDTINIKSSLFDYSVEFVEDFTAIIGGFDDSAAYVIDRNVYGLYSKKLDKIQKRNVFLMDAVEEKKNMDTVMEIISFLQTLGARKNWKLICIGGGITQDVSTMASDLFLRNIDWYFIPTTLLAMTDSCIGGKCGINFKNIKNQIGVFYPPRKIFIDVKFLSTLKKLDYINGWGELLKFSLTSDSKFYERLKKEKNYIPCENIVQYIHLGLQEKKRIIEEDEFESDVRRVLNYGHSFGHALEAYTGNNVSHGMAVIWGIDVVNYVAAKKGLISEEYYLDIKALIKRAFLQNEIIIEKPESLFGLLKTDKKMKGDTLNFAILDAPSHLIVYPMKIDSGLEKIFECYLRDTHEYYCH